MKAARKNFPDQLPAYELLKIFLHSQMGLIRAMEAAGIHAWETDLAELIVQLGHDKPSHILVPAIHRNRSEIRDIFLREMPDTDESLTPEPADLAEIEITPSGLGLHWPRLDADVYVPGFMKGIYGTRRWMAALLGAEGGKSSSPAKAAAARTNGAKGGRPRKQA